MGCNKNVNQKKLNEQFGFTKPKCRSIFSVVQHTFDKSKSRYTKHKMGMATLQNITARNICNQKNARALWNSDENISWKTYNLSYALSRDNL